ncbi:hypothetical protein [Mycobacteroides chelonae]|jgi:hypothetical protein|uniref:hypothetical protein n=1 Tax=Mycobacteroides chelonae TaxID=1774 RepID=UPI0012FF99BA|nr:hypothetical protein [Mycobacteroides chelonae]MBF9326029.1 hypothetical protein [Mycobacteroides chelonae]MBF9420205.1 hypothetical protein [Mycobacteroides chelonae]MBF9438673.1 hypothetical protein [Mycobacteroides chelonae]MBV6359982.1 hypothetical protein [Mycobacteroides chelonae]MEC4834414.1 hypothetical protein [Mycobacteroides chelonae]
MGYATGKRHAENAANYAALARNNAKDQATRDLAQAVHDLSKAVAEIALALHQAD